MMCSHCASVVSFNNSRMTSRATSQMSLLHMTSASMRRTSTTTTLPDEPEMACKICLCDTPIREMIRLQNCACLFCKEVIAEKIFNRFCSHFLCFQCMYQYISFEIMEGAYELSCPDPECDKQGILQIEEMEDIVGKDLTDKHRAFRLNTGKK